MPAGSPLQATALRSERPRRMHALTCLGLESAGLNNRRPSWQSEIVDVFASPTRVGIPLAPIFALEAPSPRYFAVLFPNRILIRFFFLQMSECLTLPCMYLRNIRKRKFAARN